MGWKMDSSVRCYSPRAKCGVCIIFHSLGVGVAGTSEEKGTFHEAGRGFAER